MAALAALTLGLALTLGTIEAGASDAIAAKKRCHYVKKKVHGKIKRVRVCTKPKPNPKPKPKPGPKDVAISVDAGRQAQASVGPAGGTITAQAASGAVATLSIPAGAVSDATTVTATTVASLKAGGNVKLLAGVQFGPEGLTLEKAATLTLEVPGGGTKVFGLAWFGTGHNVHRYPASRSGSTFTLRLAHFSGASVAAGGPNCSPASRPR